MLSFGSLLGSITTNSRDSKNVSFQNETLDRKKRIERAIKSQQKQLNDISSKKDPSIRQQILVKRLEQSLAKLKSIKIPTQQPKSSVGEPADCCGCQVIPLTFDGSPITIAQPGNYVLQNSNTPPVLTGITNPDPTAPTTLITVKASNVKIDLCGNVLTGTGNQTASFSPSPAPSGGITNDTRVDSTAGIVINGGLTNVEIFNGTLQYFSVFGIEALGANSDIYLHDLLIQNCSTVTLPVFVSFAGIYLNNVSNSQVKNITFQKNTACDLFLFGCASTHVSDISSEGLRGGAFFELTDLGNIFFVSYGVQAVSIQSQDLNGNSGQTFKNILINDIQSLSAMLGMFITGFPPGSQNPGPHGAIIENCVVSNLSTPLSDISFINDPGTCEVRGIAVETLSSFATIKDCQVSGINFTVTTGPGSVTSSPGFWNTITGFNFEATAGISVQNCRATNLSSAGWITGSSSQTPGETFANQMPIAGLTIQGNCKDITAVDCFMSNIDGGSNSANPTLAAGFIVQGHYTQDFLQNSATFKDCVVKFVQGGAGSSDYLVSYQGDNVQFCSNNRFSYSE